MRWAAALSVIVALAVTPTLSLVCDARCLDGSHGAEPHSGMAHHAPDTALLHPHLSHHGTTPGTGRADTTTVAARSSGATPCAAHVEQAVSAAPRQWAGACVALGPEAVTPIVYAIYLDPSSPPDARVPHAPPRLAIPLRI